MVLFWVGIQNSESAAHLDGQVLLLIQLLVESLVALGAVLLHNGRLQLEEVALREFKHGRFGQESGQTRWVTA